MKNKVLYGHALDQIKLIPDKHIQCCVTSPPYYGLRDYGLDPVTWDDGWSGCLGLEPTPELFIKHMVDVFREVKRILRDDGVLWVNMGDSYAGNKEGNTNGTAGKVKQKVGVNDDKRKRSVPNGLKSKDLIGIPWMLAFALRADGWYLRQDIIWSKPNPMPESVTDRCTKSHEYIFLLSKKKSYYFDNEAIKEKAVTVDYDARPDGIARNRAYQYDSKENELRGYKNLLPDGQPPNSMHLRRADGLPDLPPADGKRNKRSVWTVSTRPYAGAHFATFPPDLIIPCIKAGSKAGDIIFDPFMGSGTTAMVAKLLGRNYLGTEANVKYEPLIEKRLDDALGMFRFTREEYEAQ